ncbi:MAG: ABC transporter ATP-binding protein [Lachnospiraceae bacterium]|nr:ABC transporter ATP-binding protein [Lachnospiraceae bacterium]
MLEVKGAAFSYGKPEEDLFRELSFAVQPGETLAVLGPNGAGKTTLLRCVMRFLKFREGDAQISGESIRTLSNHEFWKRISYVPQAKKLVFGYSALNMVTMGLSQNIGFGRTPSKSDYEKAYALLERFGIAHLAEHSCNILSGGELQMVLIARALIKEPKILIMDEPESNLDMRNQLVVLNTIDRLNEENLSIVINTHYPDHALRCAKKTLIIGHREHLFGDTPQVITQENIRRFFEIESDIVQASSGERILQGIIPLDIVRKSAAG